MNKNIVIVLLVIIIGLLAFLAFKPKEISNTPLPNEEVPTSLNNSTYQPAQNNSAKIPDQESFIGWEITQRQDNQVYYKEGWKATPVQNGYLFELSNGDFINWGSAEECSDNKNFVYGASGTACVNGWTAYTGLKDIRMPTSKETLREFGDFVLKNQ